jgi:hypothetical protein
LGDLRLESVAVDRSAFPRVFAGSAFLGLFRSVDGGMTFERIAGETFTNDFEVNILEADPLDPDTIYAVRGKNVLWKSRDGGETWESNSTLPPGRLQALAIAPTDSHVLYAGNFYHGSEVPNPIDYCLARSLDAGVTWQGVPCSTLRNHDVLAVAVDPVDSSVVYAATIERTFKSLDSGATWTELVLHSYIDQIHSITISISPVDRQVVYVSNLTGLLTSTDAGATWAATVSEDGATVTSALADPSDARTVYLGQSDGVFRSSDRGATWTRADTGMNDFSVTDLAFGGGVQTLFAASPDGRGPYRSANGGGDWSPNAQFIFSTKAVAADPTDPDFVYTVAYGIFRSTDGGAAWAQVRESDGARLTSVAVDPQDSSLVYVGEDPTLGPGGVPIGGGVLWSGDRGETWNAPPLDSLFAVLSLSVSPTGESVLAGSRQGVFRSDDHGASWSATALSNLSVAAVRHAAGQVVYAATSSGAFRSDDGGAHWSTASGGIEGKALSALAVDPVGAETVFASDGYVVFVTHDGGASWSELSVTGLDGAQVLTLLAAPGGGSLYAGTDHGVFAVHVRRTRALPAR